MLDHNMVSEHPSVLLNDTKMAPACYRGDKIDPTKSKNGYNRLGEYVKSGEICLIDISKAPYARELIDVILWSLSAGIPYAGFEAKKKMKIGFFSLSMSNHEIQTLIKSACNFTKIDCSRNLYFLSNDISEEVIYPLCDSRGSYQFSEMLSNHCDFGICDADSVLSENFGIHKNDYSTVVKFFKQIKSKGKSILILDSSGLSKNLIPLVDVHLTFEQPKKTGRLNQKSDLFMTIKKSPRQNIRGKSIAYCLGTNSTGSPEWSQVSNNHQQQPLFLKRNISSVIADDDSEDVIAVFKKPRQ